MRSLSSYDAVSGTGEVEDVENRRRQPRYVLRERPWVDPGRLVLKRAPPATSTG